MKICVTSQGDQLDSQVEARFGRSPYFLIVDTETREFEAILNPNVTATGGVGIQSGQLMAQKGVKVVLTGKVGPNASETLEAAGISVILNVSGSVAGAVEQYKKGELKTAQGPNADKKSGLNP